MSDLIELTDEMIESGIYTVVERVDESGKYIFINGDTGYPAYQWTVEEAIADYLTYEAKMKRDDAFYRAYGFWED